MTVTLIVITADFVTPDGQTPTGSVRFDLTGTLSDPADDLSIPAREVEVTVNNLGRIAQPLVANGGAGVVPSSNYRVRERIVGAPERDYYATVPVLPTGARQLADAAVTGGLSILSSATGAFSSLDVGAYVYCAALPCPVTIKAVASSTVVELSAAALVTGSGLAALVGASTDLSSLRPL